MSIYIYKQWNKEKLFQSNIWKFLSPCPLPNEHAMWPHEWPLDLGNWPGKWKLDIISLKSSARELYFWSKCHSIGVDQLFIFMQAIIIYQHGDSMQEGSASDPPSRFEMKPWLEGHVSSTPLFFIKSGIFHVTFLFVSVVISHRKMNHVKRCQFIYTNNKRKEDYFNPRFVKIWVLVLDPMHMKCGLMRDRKTWATNLENGGLTLYV
jgi:hypothetical protein